MNTTITNPALQVGRGTTHGALTVFPVWVEGPSIPRVQWRTDALHVAEREGNPAVDELVVSNPGATPAVLLEGDVLEGGLQNRMAVDELLLAPGRASVVPVRCVEEGRWHGLSGQPGGPGAGGPGAGAPSASAHRASGRRSPYSVRFGVTTDAAGRPDQHQVWSRVERFEREFGRTGTSSLVEHLSRRAAPRFEPVQGQRGVIIGICGQVAAAEVFGSRYGFAQRISAVTDAAWLDAQSALAAGAPPIETPGWAARDFAAAFGRMSLEDRGAAGAGLRVASAPGEISVRGLALRVTGAAGASAVHMTAVNTNHPVLALA